MLRSIRAEVCLSFDVCLAARMFVLSGPFMNEGVSSDSMIKICCFCASVSDVWVKWSIVVGSRALDDSEGKIWMCWLVLGSHRTKFRVGTSDRPICCLVVHPLFWWQWHLENMNLFTRDMKPNEEGEKISNYIVCDSVLFPWT
jgi:hypothetical protein